MYLVDCLLAFPLGNLHVSVRPFTRILPWHYAIILIFSLGKLLAPALGRSIVLVPTEPTSNTRQADYAYGPQAFPSSA
jgi:hypothetical protein